MWMMLFLLVGAAVVVHVIGHYWGDKIHLVWVNYWYPDRHEKVLQFIASRSTNTSVEDVCNHRPRLCPAHEVRAVLDVLDAQGRIAHHDFYLIGKDRMLQRRVRYNCTASGRIQIDPVEIVTSKSAVE